MRLNAVVVLAAAGLVIAGASIAADDPIMERQDIMRKNQDATKIVFDMVAARTPFDAAKAAAAMKTLQEDMAKFVTLFPAGSDKGDTNASPAVWQKMDDFKARAAKLSDEAKKAEAAVAMGVEGLRPTLQSIGAACFTCHRDYRVRN